jgi:hypothetical protein
MTPTRRARIRCRVTLGGLALAKVLRRETRAEVREALGVAEETGTCPDGRLVERRAIYQPDARTAVPEGTGEAPVHIRLRRGRPRALPVSRHSLAVRSVCGGGPPPYRCLVQPVGGAGMPAVGGVPRRLCEGDQAAIHTQPTPQQRGPTTAFPLKRSEHFGINALQADEILGHGGRKRPGCGLEVGRDAEDSESRARVGVRRAEAGLPAFTATCRAVLPIRRGLRGLALQMKRVTIWPRYPSSGSRVEIANRSR